MAAYDNISLPGAPGAPSYAAPLLDFSPIGNLAKDFYEGATNKRQYDLQRAFQNGIPRTQDGNIDYAGMADTLARKGGIDQAIGVANTGAQLQASAGASDFLGGRQPQPQPQQQPRPTAPVFAPGPQQQQPKLSSMGTDNDGAPTVRSTMSEVFGDRDVSAVIPRLAQSLGVQPDAPLTPQQVVQLKQRLTPAQERVPQPQQPTPVMPQSAPQEAGGIPEHLRGLIPDGWKGTVQQYRDGLAARAASPLLPKAAQDVFAERLKAIDAALAKDAERTKEQKNALDPSVSRQAGQVELEKKVAESQGKAIGGVIEAGQSAQKRLASLQVMKDALTRGEGSISTGPFAETVLHAKQAIGNLFGIDVSGTTEAEVAHKIGFQLASQAVKEISARPTQFEFARALENNPGILLSPKGSKFMIDVLGQTARHDAELAKLAQRRENWADWQGVQDKFYQTHPVMSPFDRKRPLSEKDLSVLSQGSTGNGGEGWPVPSTTPAASGLPAGWSVKVR